MIIKNIEPQDKEFVRNISLKMLETRGKYPYQIHFHDSFSKEAFDKKNEKALKEGKRITKLEDASSVIGYHYIYLKAFRELTEFIYNTTKYKVIFEKIFYPNPKEYYKLIMTKKENLPEELRDYDSEQLEKIIDKSAQDGLLKLNGAFR